MAGFPREGSTFAILSSGNAADAYGAQSVQRSHRFGLTGARRAAPTSTPPCCGSTSPSPPSANCLMGFDFKFLSEEYPEYVGQSYNDAFIAELDAHHLDQRRHHDHRPATTSRSTRTATSSASTPPARPSSTPPTRPAPRTTAAPTILTAATPLTPGAHSLYFTIFDQATARYDSAVLIDNLRIGHVNDTATECQPGVSAPKTQVTPAAATFSDPYGAASDTYTVPSTLGVEYRVDGVAVAAGTYPGTGPVDVTAVADEGYEISGTSAWSHTFTDVQPATAVDPTQVDAYGTADDTYTIPSATGVQYRVDGADVAAGTYPGTGTVVVTAVAQSGYELTAGPTSWSLPFTDITLVTAEDPTQVDTYGTADDTYTVPATPGVQYRVDGADVAAGTYPGRAPSW